MSEYAEVCDTHNNTSFFPPINGMLNLPYLTVNIDACTMRNPHYAKIPCRLAKVSQTVPKSLHPTMMLSSHCNT